MVLPPMVRPSWIRPPASMPVRPTTEPTDRSMPPVMMTKVMPRASMPYSATCLATMVSVLGWRNEEDAKLKKMTSMISTMKVRPFSRVISS